jgi:Tol biopolymer transport system component
MPADGGRPLDLGPGRYPGWSPNGSQIVYQRSDRNDALWVMGSDGSDPYPLGVSGAWPAWSPDGRTIAFSTGHGIGIVSADGTFVRSLVDAEGECAYPSWSADGQALSFSYDLSYEAKDRHSMRFEVFVMRSDGSDIHRLTDLTSPSVGMSATRTAWSPTATAPDRSAR